MLRSKAISQSALWLCVLPLLSTQLNAILLPCKYGWKPITSSGTCIKIYREQKTWWDAHRSCQLEDADLMVVLEPKTFNFVKALLKPGLSVYINYRKTGENIYTTQIEEHEDENTYPNNTCGTVSSSFFITYVSCSTNENYICEKKAGFCPDKWITSAFSGTCFRIFRGNKSSWADARKICQRENGDLVTILDKDTNELIGNHLQALNENYAYIGINDQQKEGTFKWLDFNDKVEFSQWYPNEPAKSTNQKHCTLTQNGALGADNFWVTADCDQKQAFVCEMFSDCKNEKYGMICPLDCGSTNCAEQACNPRSGVCQKGCKSGYAGSKCDGFCPDEWITSASSGTCIRLFTGNKSTWADARKICQRENGDLVTILDKDTNELIGNQLQTLNENYAYIGLNDQNQEGTFQWLDFNDMVEFSFWNSGQPGNSTPQKDCTLVQTGTKADNNSWVTADCDQKQAFVCEMFADCESQKFGMLCPLDCESTNCAKQACNPRTGVCQEGCKSGFFGTKCDARAGSGFAVIIALVVAFFAILIRGICILKIS